MVFEDEFFKARPIPDERLSGWESSETLGEFDNGVRHGLSLVVSVLNGLHQAHSYACAVDLELRTVEFLRHSDLFPETQRVLFEEDADLADSVAATTARCDFSGGFLDLVLDFVLQSLAHYELGTVAELALLVGGKRARALDLVLNSGLFVALLEAEGARPLRVEHERKGETVPARVDVPALPGVQVQLRLHEFATTRVPLNAVHVLAQADVAGSRPFAAVTGV